MDPPPPGQGRPARARARELREQGLDYEEIAAALGVSKSSVSLWVRDMPRPERLSYEECRKRSAEGAQRYWAAERPLREARREAVRAAAAAEIGRSDRAGDPDRRGDRLLVRGREEQAAQADRIASSSSTAIPALIKFFLRFLDAAGVEPAQDLASACTFTRRRMWPPRSGSGRASPGRIHASSTGRTLKTPQPEDRPQERGRRLPRLPARRGQAERGPLPADRRLGPARSWPTQRDPSAPESTQLGIEPDSPATELPGEDSNLR